MKGFIDKLESLKKSSYHHGNQTRTIKPVNGDFRTLIVMITITRFFCAFNQLTGIGFGSFGAELIHLASSATMGALLPLFIIQQSEALFVKTK